MRTFQELKYTDMRDENNQLLDINSVKVIKNSTVKKYNDQGNFGSLSDNQNLLNVESLVFYSVGQNEVGHYLFIDTKGIKL